MEIEIIKPFGPSIVKLKMSDEIIKELNIYTDEIVKDTNKSSELSHGNQLVGNVHQEILLHTDFMKKIKWAEFLANACQQWVAKERGKQLKKFEIIKSWIVRQFKNEYNPIHYHSGSISGVGYLKMPKNFIKSKKKSKTNGTIDFIHGSRSFLNKSIFNHKPKVGDMIIFPNYLMHTAYPFNVDGERRSFSFNIDIDKKTLEKING